jgi:hypothetical protein
MSVIVYKNLIRGEWFVGTISGQSSVDKVIGHEKEITLANVRFIVREASRQRVVHSRCHEVHAWAIGEIVADPRGLVEAP